MSLLMDALRKAEQAKRQAESTSTSQPNLELEPSPADLAGRPPTPQSGAPLPELPSKLELLDDQFGNVTGASSASRQKTGAVPATKAGAEKVDRERQAAQQIFAAKEPQQASRRGFYLGLAAITLVVASGIGGYFWWQLQPRTMLLVPDPTARSPAPPVTESQPPATAAAVTLPVAGTGPGTTAPESDARPVPASARTPAAVARIEDDEAPPAPRPARAPRPTVERGQFGDAPAAPAGADSALRISRSRPQPDPALERGYGNFQSGNLTAARSDYEQVLRRDPHNADALNGLALIALRDGAPQAAEAYFLRALEADPQDATAQAGLVGLRGQADPVQAESRLKSLAAAQPAAHGTHFALGNLYAGQGRWHEAQQAYFRAHTGDPENPDYQFNLAVSLDQLRQPRLALQYYQGALSAAASRAAAFDQAQAAARVRELQRP